MQIIQRSLDGVALPDIRGCEHLASGNGPAWRVAVKCANCGGHLCVDCKDYVAICHACPAAICKECQASARRRNNGSGTFTYDYLCNPCRDKQDAAKRKFLAEMVSRDWDHHIWLDELLDKSECAIQRAKVAL